MLTEIMWANLFRIVQFGVRCGVLLLTFWMPESGIRLEILPHKPADAVEAPAVVMEKNTMTRYFPGASGEGVDMVDRNSVFISLSDR